MNFKELLDRPVQSVDTNAHVLIGYRYSFVDGFEDFYNLGDSFQNQDKITIHYLKYFCFDGRRIWQLYYVKFEGELVMICKNAGREGDDEYDFAVFNKDIYNRMTGYIKSFEKLVSNFPLANLEDDASGYFEFYGNSLDGHFESY
jgi:hypothetical protein